MFDRYLLLLCIKKSNIWHLSIIEALDVKNKNKRHVVTGQIPPAFLSHCVKYIYIYIKCSFIFSLCNYEKKKSLVMKYGVYFLLAIQFYWLWNWPFILFFIIEIISNINYYVTRFKKKGKNHIYIFFVKI